MQINHENKQQKCEKKYLTIQQTANKIKNENLYLIGICGIPGAGKSTVSSKLHQIIQHSVVLPMDGFHIYRKELDKQGKRRRGAPFTFDLQRFRHKLLELKQRKSFPIYFPSFDHALKDPIQNDIVITSEKKCVIIEGLYIFDPSLRLDQQNYWDLKLFIDEYKDICLPRVIRRCIENKIEETEEKAIQRATKSDMANGDYVLENTSWEKMYFIKNPNQS